MESWTMLLLVTLAGPSLGYPYTRGGQGGWMPDSTGLGDYMRDYAGVDQYGMQDYQPSPRYIYGAPRPRISKEAVAALLDYMEYMDYDTYSDDEGTWYDDSASADFAHPLVPREDSTLMKLLYNQRPASSSPVRYSLEDLETLERTAAREDNTENQLHALTQKAVNKKSLMPMLSGRVALSPRFLMRGQKEETFDIPTTSVRRPIFARAITTYPEQPETQQISEDSESKTMENSSSSSSSTTQQPSEEEKKTPKDNNNSRKNSSEESKAAASVAVPRAAETPYLKNRYEALRSFLNKERKVRQERDDNQREERRELHKRFIPEQESLTQQLASLKKTVA